MPNCSYQSHSILTPRLSILNNKKADFKKSAHYVITAKIQTKNRIDDVMKL